MSHLFLSSKQVLQVDDVSVKTTGRGGTKAGRVGEEERCNCFIPRRVKPRAAWRILAQRVPPNACIVVSSRGKAMGPFHIALEKKMKEKYSHRLSRDCDRPSNFFLRTKPQGKVLQISLFVFICPRVVLPATTTAWFTKKSAFGKKIVHEAFFFILYTVKESRKKINASPTQHTRTQNTHI